MLQACIVMQVVMLSSEHLLFFFLFWEVWLSGLLPQTTGTRGLREELNLIENVGSCGMVADEEGDRWLVLLHDKRLLGGHAAMTKPSNMICEKG